MRIKRLILPLIAGAIAGLVVAKKKAPKETEAPQVYEPVTWSQFNEYKRLEMILKGFAIESMIDVPCLGSDRLHRDLGLKRYIGVTASRDRARALQAQYGSTDKTFLSFEVDVDPLPKADLILCWDKLCAYPTSRARSALVQFKKSGAKFLLMRHYPSIKKNHKNKTGTFQPVNWTLPPYNLPEPIIHIMEEGPYGMESLALWNLEKV